MPSFQVLIKFLFFLTLVFTLGCNQKNTLIPFGIYSTPNGKASIQIENGNHFKMLFQDFTIDNTFETTEINRQSELAIISELEGDTVRAELLIESDSLFFIKYYKSLKGIEHHIDEIGKFSRHTSASSSKNCSSLVFKSVEPGAFYIHFENEISLADHNCDSVFIDHLGLTRSNSKIDIRDIKDIQAISVSGEKIPNCNSQGLDCEYCCEVLGFNQIPRSNLNGILNQKTDGDVLMVEIRESK